MSLGWDLIAYGMSLICANCRSFRGIKIVVLAPHGFPLQQSIDADTVATKRHYIGSWRFTQLQNHPANVTSAS